MEGVAEIVTIPTLPSVVVRLRAVLADAAAGMPEVAAVVREDPAIAAKVLRVSNSAAYGQRAPITTIERAASVLGKDAIANLVLQASLVREFEHISGLSFDVEGLWRHAIHTARVCEAVAEACASRLCEKELAPADFYTIGLLHDIGRIVMLGQFGESYVELLATPMRSTRDAVRLEADRFGFSHAQIGSVVATLWTLPKAIVSSIELHHASPSTIGSNLPALVVLGADVLSHSVMAGAGRAHFLPPEDCRRVGLDGQTLVELVRCASNELLDIHV